MALVVVVDEGGSLAMCALTEKQSFSNMDTKFALLSAAEAVWLAAVEESEEEEDEKEGEEDDDASPFLLSFVFFLFFFCSASNFSKGRRKTSL